MISQSKFRLGRLVATTNLTAVVPPDAILAAVQRHASGDWGDVCEEDRLANEEALLTGSRLMSVYFTSDGRPFWVITEWDRSVTTVLLPEDY